MNNPLGQPNAVVEFLSRTQDIGVRSIVFPWVYGSFSSSSTQTIAQLPTPTPLTYDTTDYAGGGLVLGGTIPTADILISTSGTYRVITSVQLNKTAGGASTGEVNVWFAIDGTAVPNSATKTELTNAIESVMTVEILTPLFAGQKLSVIAGANVATAQALAVGASPPVPAVPSIITIVQRIA